MEKRNCVWYIRKYKKEICIQRYRSDVINLYGKDNLNKSEVFYAFVLQETVGVKKAKYDSLVRENTLLFFHGLYLKGLKIVTMLN